MSPASAMNRVLIVVDDPLLVADFTEALTGAGYSVLAASSCAGALEQAAASEFEVALVGLGLPDGLGGTLLGRLRALRPDARPVLVTSDSTVDEASAAVKAGAFAYLAKSSTSEQVLLQGGEALEASRSAYEQAGHARSTESAERLAAIKAMTAGVSHEIRNPLNAASLQLSLLERGLEALEVSLRGPLLKTVGLVREEMARLGHVIEDFLLMANPRPLQRRWLDVSALTHLVLDFLAKDAERQLVHVSRHVGQGQMAMVDEEQLRQVLMNIGLNALEATPANGVIDVTVAATAQHVTITIDDSGPGIAAAVRNRIFDPFFTTKALGSGLGLSIAHGIVAQHGGVVSVTESPLKGARVAVTLPLNHVREGAR